ncbi:hypothetical protein [Lysobacter sp. A289]
MLIAAPLAMGLALGFINGFPTHPTALHAFVSFAFWLGASVGALVVAWIALMIRKPQAGWTLLVVIVGLTAYLMHLDDQDNQRASRSPNSEQSTSSATTQTSVVDRASVNEVVEDLPPHMAGVRVDEAVIAGMNQAVADNYLQRWHHRQTGKPTSTLKIDAAAHTMRVNTEGHVLYATELTVQVEGKPLDGMPKLRVIWNIQDNKIKRVFCIFPGKGHSWRKGACGKQVAETFGWDGWWRR